MYFFKEIAAKLPQTLDARTQGMKCISYVSLVWQYLKEQLRTQFGCLMI